MDTILSLDITKYRCPYCQKWHDWPEDKNLIDAFCSMRTIKLKCPEFSIGEIGIYYKGHGILNIHISSLCQWVEPIKREIRIDIRDNSKLQINLNIKKELIGIKGCNYCSNKSKGCIFEKVKQRKDSQLQLEFQLENPNW